MRRGEGGRFCTGTCCDATPAPTLKELTAAPVHGLTTSLPNMGIAWHLAVTSLLSPALLGSTACCAEENINFTQPYANARKRRTTAGGQEENEEGRKEGRRVNKHDIAKANILLQLWRQAGLIFLSLMKRAGAFCTISKHFCTLKTRGQT